ncbi:MAG TPA: hypothetical protein VIL55_14870 [Naasia sp.]|jgi:hypothetical protein
MTSPDPRAAAERLAYLTALGDLVKGEVALQREAVNGVLRRSEAQPVEHPVTGAILCRVRKSNPKATTTARITDHVALTEWITREYPERIQVRPAVSENTDAVLAVLAEHAPHLVDLVTTVPEWATDEIVRKSVTAGTPCGPDGQADVPGIAVETREGTPSVSVADKAPDFLLQVAELATSGRLTLDGTLRELPAGPAAVDAESEAA